ncbi:MAG: GNAT family N-acetyltransferase [Paracoccaceae bacterium]
MSASLTLATPEHLERLGALVAAFHTEIELTTLEQTRQAALAPLCNGIPHGSAYLIGPTRAPIGYIILTFGWSVEFGGLDGFIDELYIRPNVRGRGIATEVLLALPLALAEVGLRALHLEVRTDDQKAQRLYGKCGFQMRQDYHLMTRSF